MWPLQDGPPRVTPNLTLQNTLSGHLTPSIPLSCFIYSSVNAFTFLSTLAQCLCLNWHHPLPCVCVLFISLSTIFLAILCVFWTDIGSRDCASAPQRGVNRHISLHLADLHSWMTYRLWTDWGDECIAYTVTYIVRRMCAYVLRHFFLSQSLCVHLFTLSKHLTGCDVWEKFNVMSHDHKILLRWVHGVVKEKKITSQQFWVML